MTLHPFRAVVTFTVVLVALSGLAYLLQQTLYARPPTLDLTPTALEQSSTVVPSAPAVPTGAKGDPDAGAGVPVIDEGWLGATSQASGVPLVALRAYARAELMAPRGCGVGWTTLAGIGWVESQHGLLGGRTLLADGHSSSLILGPALDGTRFKAIPATAQSRQWHGDRLWDHAFGPMQFISGTWVDWQSDGDGDGVADPNDLDDASYAAARYLCAGGRDLTSATGWTSAVLSYNNARSYLDAVHAAATAYADRTR